jgi:hypothetical protein
MKSIAGYEDHPTILCIAMVEDRTNLDKQILKQTTQPDRVVFYIDDEPAKGILERRKRIAENHEKLKAIVEAYKPDLVWQVEQDGDYPEDCLERLIQRYNDVKDDNFGYVSGIQVGRHGLYCIGAWRNFTEDSFESIDHDLKGLQPIDATGFYCILAPADVWLSGKSSWNGEPYGPDVVWSLSIDRKKYVDMDNQIGHIVKTGIIRPEHISTTTVRFYKENGRWEYKQLK